MVAEAWAAAQERQSKTIVYTFADPPPFAHQRRALSYVHARDGKILLAMPMRTGKTRVAIDWAGIAYRNYGLRRVLVVCPLSVMSVWADQIKEFSTVRSEVYPLNGSTRQRIDDVEYMNGCSQAEGIWWIIVNYEGVWRSLGKQSLTNALERWQPDLVIADEAHRLKTATSRQSKAVAKIGKVARWRLALTGTPITKTPLDFFGEARFLDDQIFTRPDGKPMSWTGFRNEYGIWGGASGYELKGYRQLPKLLNTISRNSFSIKLEDCFDLPGKSFEDVAVKLPKTTQKIYRQMAKEMIAELESGTVVTASIVLTKLLRLSQITSGFINDPGGIVHDLDTAKIEAALDMIEDFTSAGEKVVVFCRFKHDYHRLAQALNRSANPSGHAVLQLTGETPASERDGVIRRFHTDPRAMVFIAQTQAGSLGIDLTPARFAIFLSLDYNWATYAQAQERIYGPKQSRPVTIHHLVVPRTIDTVVLNALQHKGDIAKAVMHDPGSIIAAWNTDEGLDGDD